MKRNRKIMLLVLIAGTFILAGCQSFIDPDTGQRYYVLDEGVVKVIDTAGNTIETVGPALAAGASAINPGWGAIVGLVVGIAGSLCATWKKWKKPLAEKSELLDKIAAGARAAADVIDEVVKPNANLWRKVKPKLKDAQRAGAIMPDKL